MNQLEREAKLFLQRKTPTQVTDNTGFRCYMAAAITGYLSRGEIVPEEVLEKAAELAVLALEKERELTGG